MGLEKEKLEAETERLGKEWEKVKAERGKLADENTLKRSQYWGAGDMSTMIGTQLMLVTFSPVSDDVQAVISTCKKNVFVYILKLHEFDSSGELTSHIQAFFARKDEGFEHGKLSGLFDVCNLHLMHFE